MRTTLNLDDQVAQAAKRYAAQEGTSLTAVIDAALRQFLAAHRRKPQYFELQLRTRRTRVRAGVDIEDRNALYELLDGRRQ